MASSIFLIAETQLFVETVERIGNELDCTVHVAHSPAEAMLPPSGNIDLIAFEPTNEADKGFALLDILRLRYQLPQRKVVIFGGMPEVQDATTIPLPLDYEAFTATLRELLGTDASGKKPAAAGGKSAPGSSQGPRFQSSKSTAEQPLKLTEPLKLTQAVKAIQPLKASALEKGTQIVRAKDVVQEIQLVQAAQLGKEPLGKSPSKATLKESQPAKSVHSGKGTGDPRTAKQAESPKEKSEPAQVSRAVHAVAHDAVKEVRKEKEPKPAKEQAAAASPLAAAPATSKKQPARSEKRDQTVLENPLIQKQPTPFESTPSWLRTALGLPASRPPPENTAPLEAQLDPKHSAATKAPEPGPKQTAASKTAEPRPKHIPASAVLPPSHSPSKIQTSDSTPGWLKSALGISSPSAVQQADPIDSQPDTENLASEKPIEAKPPTGDPSDFKRDELPADFEPSVLTPEAAPSGDPSPDWLAKALGIESSDSSVAAATSTDQSIDLLGEETSKPESPKPPEPPSAQEAKRPHPPAIAPVAPPPEVPSPVPPAIAPLPVAQAPAQPPGPHEHSGPHKVLPKKPAAPTELQAHAPHHEAKGEPPPAKPEATPEAAVEDHSSRRTALEAELKATRNMLVEERTSRSRISKELEQLRALHTREVEERRAEQELARVGQAEREAKAAQLLEEQTAKIAELTALQASVQEALATQERGRTELQDSQSKLQANYERELNALRDSHKRAIDELQESHQRAMAELQESQQRTLFEIQERDQQELTQLRDELAILKEAFEAKELAHTIEVQTVEELKTRIAELTRENEESKNYKEKLEAALAAESLRADEIAGRLVEAESNKARTRRLADVPRSGKLSLSELATLVSQLVELQANVRVELASPTATRTLWITNGALSAAASDNEQLITLARRDELIGENQERELAALRMARPSEQREALVARGFLSPEVAAALVARWMAHVAEAAFAESATTYRMLEEQVKPNTKAPEFALPLLPLVRTAIRRARPWESAVAEFAYAVLVPVSRDLELSLAGFSPEEAALIESAAPTSTADELVAASGLSREQAYSSLLAAYYLDFLRIDSYRDPPPPADPEVGMQRLQAKYDQVQEADYFAILGLPRSAGPDEVRRAYELLSNEFHPLRFSTHQDPAVQERAAAVWSSITEAAEALGDDRLRVEYAQHLID